MAILTLYYVIFFMHLYTKQTFMMTTLYIYELNAELKGNFKKHEFSCQPFSVPHHFCNPKFHFIYYVNLLITARNIFHWVMLTKILFWRTFPPQKSTLAVHLPHYKLMFKIVNICFWLQHTLRLFNLFPCPKVSPDETLLPCWCSVGGI